MKQMKKIIIATLFILLTACQSQPETSTSATPATSSPKETAQRNIPIVGGVETTYVLPMKMPFHARMDTGAETSSIDAKNIKPFERDGEKWISFDIINRKNGETHHFEKPIKRKTGIVRSQKSERRYVVYMKVKMGKELINSEFTLNDREKFDYQVLVGRNIINGRFVIDPSLKNTLH